MADQLHELKQKIQQSSIFSPDDKKEWLFLLPKMTDQQMKELERILAVRMPASPAGGPPTEERKNQRTEELKEERVTETFRFPATPSQSPLAVSSPSLTPSHQGREIGKKISSPLPALSEVEGVGGLTVSAMRNASSIYEFFDDLAAKLAVAVKNRTKTPQEIVAGFQQSPLYRAYVEDGKQMLEGLDPQALTRSEFEAVADFRTSLKKVLQET